MNQNKHHTTEVDNFQITDEYQMRTEKPCLTKLLIVLIYNGAFMMHKRASRSFEHLVASLQDKIGKAALSSVDI